MSKNLLNLEFLLANNKCNDFLSPGRNHKTKNENRSKSLGRSKILSPFALENRKIMDHLYGRFDQL